MNGNDNFSSRMEVINSIKGFVDQNLNYLLKPVDESWQPADFLPDFQSERWLDEVSLMRQKAKALPDDLLVVLIGDMVTEEALPTYQTWLNRLEGVTDTTGDSDNPWAKWSRGWTSEENRHGDLLNKYLFLSGRVNMKSVECTIHHLINNGFNPHTENDPYLGFIYTSFQERATKISHRNVSRLALKAGDDSLHKICGVIAGDEARHEKAYRLFMTKIFEVDPVNALLSFSKMMKAKITMPAFLMYDGNDKNLFVNFSKVAQKLEIYTAKDYAEIIGNLVKGWDIDHLLGMSGMAAKAQDYLCGLSERYSKLAGRFTLTGNDIKFSWIFNREVTV